MVLLILSLLSGPSRADLGVHEDILYFSRTTAGAVTSPALNCGRAAVGWYALQATGVGAVPTAWSVVLEGSLDGVSFTTILSSDNLLQSDGQVVWNVERRLCVYVRLRVVSLTLGAASGLRVSIVAGK